MAHFHESAGSIGVVEKVGNKLPDPFWLSVILSGVVAVTSWAGAKTGMAAKGPGSGEMVLVESLLTGENISK
ncbi:AbgT family transporter [Corynebacterium hadale]|uniref:AbgT family transporter n=1 Tax=Corynebacterium hadale TaxID=2026255 RepID=UPI000D6A742F|nr:AbgT family transporter [Corynebacterium hadale]